MKLSSEYVGARSKPFETEVTARRSMNYAASVGDDNPRYFDDLGPNLVAPPMLVAALTWPVSSRIQEFWESGTFPSEVLERQVHFAEDVVWHRVAVAGDRLTIQGQIVAIQPHRAGTLMTVRYSAVDASGAPVFDEYAGALLRRVRCEGDGASVGDLPKFPRLESEPSPLWETTHHVDPLAPFLYDAGADIYFPIHTSPEFAKRVGLSGIIYQGAATLSVAVRELVNREAQGEPARLQALSCRFTGMVFPGSDIAVRLLARTGHAGRTDLFFEVLNAEGEKAVSGGYACMGTAKSL